VELQLVLALARLLVLLELVLQQGLVPVLEQGLVLGSSKRSAGRWCRLPAEYWF
jgi:hypothetical protein